MGQYGNQPDFGTRALTINPVGSPGQTPGQNLNSAALYIGTGGTLCVTVVGAIDTGADMAGITIFHNVPDGTFFPVIVDNVWLNNDNGINTTCSNMIALY
jgi:hypothetical protein